LYSYLEQREGIKDIEKTECDVIGLFCSILNQRLLIIDDKEFMGERQSLSAKFLNLSQIKVTCKMLNNIAFQVF